MLIGAVDADAAVVGASGFDAIAGAAGAGADDAARGRGAGVAVAVFGCPPPINIQ